MHIIYIYIYIYINCPSLVHIARCLMTSYNMSRPQSGSHEVSRSVAFCSGGGGLTNSVEDRGQRERGSGGSNPLVRGSAGSYNLVQEISFHIVKFSQFLVF